MEEQETVEENNYSLPNLISVATKWFVDTHSDYIRLTIWTVCVIGISLVYSVSPVLGVFLFLFTIFKMSHGRRLVQKKLRGSEMLKKHQFVEYCLSALIFGFYFVIVLKFFEINFGGLLNFKPEVPYYADVLNFTVGIIIGILSVYRERKSRLVSRRYSL